MKVVCDSIIKPNDQNKKRRTFYQDGSNSSSKSKRSLTRSKSMNSSNGEYSVDDDSDCDSLFSLKSSRSFRLNKQINEKTQDFTINKLKFDQVGICGREQEISTLKLAFQKRCGSITSGSGLSQQQQQQQQPESSAEAGKVEATDPGPTVVSITGRSGTGKTTLAQALKATATRDTNAFFCTGKFDLQQQNEPYTAFAAAFSQLADQILTRDEATICEIRTQLRDAIDPEDIPVITDIVPALAALLLVDVKQNDDEPKHNNKSGSNDYGISSSAPVSSVVSTENRENSLTYIFRRLVRLIRNRNHPLILVLDDVQWIDKASLTLVKSLVTDVNNENFFLITTSRDNEINQDHPFFQALQEVQIKHNIKVESIHLKHLEVQHVNSLLSSILSLTPDRTLSLAESVWQKTSGNPFFVVEFVKNLVDQELLQFNFGSFEWKWDDIKIQSLEVTDNVADMLLNKLQLLRPATLFTLQVAACVGQSFDVDMIAGILSDKLVVSVAQQKPLDEQGQRLEEARSYDATKDSIDELVKAGLIEKVGPLCSFVHDSIQDAATKSFHHSKLTMLQLKIGQHLLKLCSNNGYEQHDLFRAVDLCNLGSSFLSKEEKEQMAMWNVCAGEASLKTAAYAEAKRYMEAGLDYLCSDRWTANHELAVKIHSGIAEASYCTADYGTMEAHTEEVIKQQDVPVGDKVRPYILRMQALGFQNKPDDAVSEGFQILQTMGYCRTTPRRPGLLHVVKELIKTRRLMKKKQGSLTQLPEMTNTNLLHAFELLDQILSYAYMTSENLFFSLCLKAVRWTLKWGTCKYSGWAMNCYSIVVGQILGDFDQAFVVGQNAIAIANQSADSRDVLAKNLLGYHAFVGHWSSDTRSSLPAFYHGFEVGMKVGDIQHAAVCLGLHDHMVFECTGKPLSEASQEVQSHIGMLDNYQSPIKIYLLPLLQAMLNLQGLDSVDSPWMMSGKIVHDGLNIWDEQAEKDYPGLVPITNTCGMYLAYVFENYEQAGKYLQGCRGFGETTQHGHCKVIRHFLCRGLVCVALAMEGIRPRQNKKEAMYVLKKLTYWQSKGNPNVVPMVSLMEAEMAFLQKQRNYKVVAEVAYKRAVQTSSRSGWLHLTALAHERAGSFCAIAMKDLYWAAHHIGHSLQCYHEWGATMKVTMMVKKYGELLSRSMHVSAVTRQLVGNDDDKEEPVSSLFMANSSTGSWNRVLHLSLIE